ncbi:uncharacterized protein LOC119386790 [Rhipicephalus sanguineus]|uniref:uncharacterized protein LOC119386790 n=1 Tax=Rhipicephalus sanguineus TaxID=34632 RepID=UPI001895840B|nr:uncharacterized protein LOC119386790 [Rhipicephalus sanguineus]
MASRQKGVEKSRKPGQRWSGTSPYCCVHGCHNSYRNTAGRQPPVKFYRFPWKSYEAERRQRWIAAVRRTRPNGEQWHPKRNETRICSVHFAGNEKSSIAEHPAYVPTLFLPCYNKHDGVLPRAKNRGQQRLQQHSSSLLVAKPSPSPTPLEYPDFEIRYVSAPTQTENDSCTGPCHLFLSTITQSSASTQVSHVSAIDKSVQ